MDENQPSGSMDENQPSGSEDTVARARAGIRAWVTAGGAVLLRAAPTAIVTAMTAAALSWSRCWSAPSDPSSCSRCSLSSAT
jgi:hypothetical protein